MKKLVIFFLFVLVVACQPAEQGAVEPVTLRLVTHDSFEIGEATIATFEEETGHTVEIVKSGDAGQMVNQSVLSKNNPLGDVIYGIDNTFLSRALDGEILLAYESPMLAEIPDGLKLDSENRALPADYGDVCLNYDKAWFAENGLEPPVNLDSLVQDTYRGLTVVENPATSSPGLAFLLATIAAYGDDEFVDYWDALRANDVLVTSGWEDAYYGAFTMYGGDRPIVVSYASSPPAEVIFAETPLDDAPTASVTGANSCFRQIEFVGILDGTEYEAAAQQLVDFILGATFQADIPMNMFVFPANQTVELPAEFVQYAAIPEQPALVDSAEIAANRESWIERWTDTVLR